MDLKRVEVFYKKARMNTHTHGLTKEQFASLDQSCGGKNWLCYRPIFGLNLDPMKNGFLHQPLQETLSPTKVGQEGVAPCDEMPECAEGVAFDAMAYPNRSLTRPGFMALMFVVIMVNIVSAVFYTALGAWPIAVFAAVDVVVVWLAFKISYRQGRLSERIMIIGDRLLVTRTAANGQQTCWSLPVYWTRLEYTLPMDHDDQIKLSLSGDVLVLGRFLSPNERGELAQALDNAMQKMKKSPPPRYAR